MKMHRLLLALLLAQASCQRVFTGPLPFPQGRLVDLSNAFDENTIYWPTESGFVLDRGFEGMTEQGYYYAAHRFSAPEHGGTHIDAPAHFRRAGWRVDEIPLDQLLGEGVLVDVSEACVRDRDYRVGVSDFESWEARHGSIPAESIVLIRTGFGRYWPDRERYMGSDARGPEAVSALHFPGLHPDAAEWLVEQRAVRAVGLDTPSIDFGQSRRFETHVALFTANVPAFENLANLSELPDRAFQVIALPMKIRGGSGAPLRIVAILPSTRPR